MRINVDGSASGANIVQVTIALSNGSPASDIGARCHKSSGKQAVSNWDLGNQLLTHADHVRSSILSAVRNRIVVVDRASNGSRVAFGTCPQSLHFRMKGTTARLSEPTPVIVLLEME